MRFTSHTKDNVALLVQRDQCRLALYLAIHSVQNNIIVARVHSNNGIVVEVFFAAVLVTTFILDTDGCLLGALVSIDHRQLSVQQVGEDMGLERHSIGESVMAMDYQEKHGISVWQVRHREHTRIGIAHLELQLVTSLEGELEFA